MGPLLSFSRLTTSFDPVSLRLTLKADSDPEFVISDLGLPYLLPNPNLYPPLATLFPV